MKKLFLLVLGLALAVLLTVILSKPRAVPEVTYEGKAISAWALELNNAATRDRAFEVFQHVDSDAALALANMLRTSDPFSGRMIKALGRRAPKKTALALYRMVNPFEAPFQRAAAVQALRAMGPKAAPAVPALSLALRDDQTVCWNAALSLAECGPVGTAALIHGLTDPAVQHRGFICYALGTQGQAASNAIPLLVAILQRAAPDESQRAAEALGDIGKLAVPALLQRITDTNMAVQLLAINGLARVVPPARECLPQLAQIAKQDQPAARLAAIQAMGRIQPKGELVTAVMTQALHDPNREIRIAAVQSLSKVPLAFQHALPEVLSLLKDPSAEVRNETVRILGEMGSAAAGAVPTLVGCLQDESETVRMSARDALDKLKPVTGGANKSMRSEPQTTVPTPTR